MRYRLKEARLKRQLTQQEVATYIGISQRNYCDIERNKSNPSWTVAQRLENFFGVPASELLAEGEEEPV
ncbi:Cro/C1-type helix-turn-helix domain [Syntrophomonas zehnderi OL-4]|uniref:Cro/C1-type helix-turn-helix domain n=1 Tax=Syntrophomonas zehnderi OL-4 TaxID=690567 RepID=A0A0E4G9I9_9FIRM|nr:helix-turn-helix transcriptional regulator [Syntrophomonas zehnderi]CFX15655.1 Cro/C1-type helix-turn-helix domain [Syntrophomonas zehnderi OL-4]